MKSILLVFVTLLISFVNVDAQPRRGLGSFGKNTIQGFKDDPTEPFASYGTNVHRLTVAWKDYSTAPGEYDWTDLDKNIARFVKAGKDLQLEFFAGDLCPDWVFKQFGSFYTTGGNRTGPWPDYRNESYRQAWFQWNRDVQAHIMSLPDNLRSHIASLLMNFGSTGDATPYKGKPTSYKPFGREPWAKESYRYWDSIVAVAVRLKGDEVYAISFNPTNQYIYFAYFYKKYNYLHKIPWFKLGDASHFYAFDGSGIPIGGGDTIAFGETQFPIPGNLAHPHKEGRMLVWQTLHKNIGSLQISPNWWKAMREDGESITTHRITDPVNLYMNSQSRGFSVPTGQVMYDDVEHYPVSTFGSLVDPASQSQVESQFDDIKDLNQLDWRAKRMLIYGKIRKNINQTRINNLLAANPDAKYQQTSFTTDPNYKQWNNDIFIDGILNYEKNLTMLNPFETSVQRRRVGPDTSMWGRGAYQFKLSNGAGEVSYNVSDAISTQGSNKMSITVHYLDEGTGSWSINCSGNNFKKVVKNNNSGLIKDMTVMVDDFRFNAGNAADFLLRYEGGDNTVFCGIEVWNISKGD